MGPSFFRSAGAKFTVILLTGNSRPEFLIAARTLSFDSLTETSGSPTMSIVGLYSRWFLQLRRQDPNNVQGSILRYGNMGKK